MFDPDRALSAGKIAALKLLKEALDDAEDVGRDRWQFAIRKAALLAAGVSVSDLRWLIVSRRAEAATEITKPGDAKRTFRAGSSLALHDADCFVLTHGGKVHVESHLSSANGAGRPDTAPIPPRRANTRRHRAAPTPHRSQESNGSASPADASRPKWRPLDGELYFRGELVRRRGRKLAALEEFLLGVFEAAEWERSVLIALPSEPIETLDQLKECVRRLNDHALLDALRFHAHAHDDGAIASWEDRVLTGGDTRHESRS